MNNGEKWYEENKDNYNLYNDPDEMVIAAFNAGMQKYKSLVKTVDPDNLPESEVLAFNYYDEMLLGIFFDNGSFTDEAQTQQLIRPTHYIEQESLIKMISGS